MNYVKRLIWGMPILLALMSAGTSAGETALSRFDGRQNLEYPVAARNVFLANMRAHLETLARIMVAISNGDHRKASYLAATGLGMESSGAMACKPRAAITETDHLSMSPMHRRLRALMPEPMKVLGRNMHHAADNLAKIERQDELKPDPAAESAALATLLDQCVRCHARYRVH